MNSMCLVRLPKNVLFSHLNPLRRIYVSTKYISPSIVPKSYFLKAALPLQTQCQNFWETFPTTDFSYHSKDGLSRENNALVYKSKLFNYAFYSQLVSIFGFAVQLFYSIKYAYKSVVLHEVVSLDVGPFTMTYDLLSLFIVCIFTLQNVFLFKVSQTALLRVYHRPKSDDYVFVTLSLNPFKSHLQLCKPGQLESLNRENLMAMLGNFELHGRKLFLNDENFKSAHHFNKLVGKW